MRTQTHELFTASESGNRAELVHSLAASPEVPFAAAELARFPSRTLMAFRQQFETPEPPAILLAGNNQRARGMNAARGVPAPPPVLLRGPDR